MPFYSAACTHLLGALAPGHKLVSICTNWPGRISQISQSRRNGTPGMIPQLEVSHVQNGGKADKCLVLPLPMLPSQVPPHPSSLPFFSLWQDPNLRIFSSCSKISHANGSRRVQHSFFLNSSRRKEGIHLSGLLAYQPMLCQDHVLQNTETWIINRNFRLLAISSGIFVVRHDEQQLLVV